MGKLFSVSMEEFHASCDQPEARAFVDGLYDEYVAQGQPKDLIGWLRERIRGEFRYVMSPPVWALETPSWPFRDGRPMIFISQVDLPRNPVTERLTWNSVIYFFGTREPTERGEKLTFAEVVQERGIHGVGAE
jgi:hypothetical protein